MLRKIGCGLILILCWSYARVATAATFGYTTVGVSFSGSTGDQSNVSKFAITETGTITKLTAYLRGTANIKGLIYSDAGGGPSVLLGAATPMNCASGGGAWCDLTFATPVVLMAGNYWLGMVGDAAIEIAYSNIGAPYRTVFAATSSYATPPSSFMASGLDFDNLVASVYATYTPGASSGSSCTGGVCTAATCNYTDVNPIINGPIHTAVTGDVINIPAGTCPWTSALTVSVGIKIIGAGIGSTILQHGFNGVQFNVALPSATDTFQLSSMTIAPTTGSGGQPVIVNINGTCNSTTCSRIRLDHLNTTGWTYGVNFLGQMLYANNVFGVIDHNTIELATGGVWIDIGHSAYGGIGANGDNSWAQPDTFGTDKALYLENNTVYTANAGGMALTDTSLGGGRFVARFNTLSNVNLQTHGTESTGRIRGGRQVEVYNNTLEITPAAQGTLLGLRSGSALAFNNVKSNTGQYNAVIQFANYRDGGSFSVWGNCNGLGPYDQNAGVVYASGTVTAVTLTGTVLSVTDSTKTWTPTQWVANPPYSIMNQSKTDANGFRPGAQIWEGAANSVTSMNYYGWSGGVDAIAWSVGDSYQILRATACLDQPGRSGAGAIYLSGTIPSPTGWANQPLNPVYEWGDSIVGGGTPTYGAWAGNSSNIRFAENVDWYEQKSPFTGAIGTGSGTRLSRPSMCTTGVAYWSTDQGSWNTSGSGGQGVLDKCTSTNNWTNAVYVPYAYPHPLTLDGSDTTPPVVSVGTLTPSAVAPTTLTLTWTKATDAVSAQAALQYEVCQSSTNNITTVANCEANGTIIRAFIADIATFNVTGLTASTGYFFNVVVRDVAGNKTAYTPVNVTTNAPPDVTPPVVGGGGVITIVGLTSTSLTLNWTKATDAITAQAALQYEVCRSGASNIGTVANCETNGVIIRSFVADIATFDVTGLTPSQYFFFNVVVRDAAGNKTAYTPVRATTAAALTLSWTRSTDVVTPQAALQYEVCQSAMNNLGTVANCEANGTIVGAFTPDIASFIAQPLAPLTTYFFNVVVRDAAGNKSAYISASGTTSTAIDAMPPVTGNSGTITTASIATTSLTLNWTRSSDDITAQPLLQYEVCRSTANNITTAANCEANGTIIRSFVADIATFDVTGLTAATSYYFNVVVRDEFGLKTAYTPVNVTTDSGPLVGGFGAITTSSIATTSLTLNWAKATDTVTAQAALQYEVCRSGVNNITTVATCEANGTIIRSFVADIATLNVTGLTPSTGYFFNVVVRDGVGNKTAYVSVGATTAMDVIPDTTPPVAGNTGILTVANLAPNSLRLNWTKATDVISAQPTLQYEVCRSATNNITTVANCEGNGVIIRSFIADIATFNAVGLTGSTAYFFNVVARDEAGNKTAYAPVTATTPPDAPPVAPSVIGLPVWADSFTGVHSWFDIGPTGVNCADMVAIAYRYDFQYSGSCGAQFRQGNPSFITAIYQDGSQALNVSGCSDAACNLAWWRANHPDWLLYQDNETANPTTVLRTYSYQAINPDFTSPGYRAFRWSQIAPIAATVTQALGYDNLLLDNNFPDITDTNYVQAKGVYPNATAANPTTPPFNPLFVGQGSYADVLDPPFTTGRIQWAAYLRDQQHALPRPLLMILNSDMKIIFNSPTHRSALISAVDGVLTQGGGLAPEYVGDSRQIWLGTMRFIEDMNAAGKAVYQELVQPGHRYEADLEPNWIRFTLASYLLAKGHAAALRLNSDEGGKCPTCTETSGLSWPVEFEATHNGTGVTGAVGIGAPCSPMRVIAGDSDSENALFMREYTHGVVVVNGSLTATYSAASLPSGAWTYKDIYNSAVTAPFNVGPVVMQPFTDWRGHIQQRYVSDASKILLKTGAASDLVCSNGSIDSTPPAFVAGPTAGSIAATSATIGWVTDELANGQVDYGLTAAYTASTTLDATLAAAHTMALGGLTPSTTYHYRVKSADVWGNLHASGDFVFNTLSAAGPLQITTASLPNGTRGAPYAQTLTASGGTPAGSGFGFIRTLTLPRPNSNLVNFPHWFCRQAPEWRTVANGGKVQSPLGHDLVFFPNTTLAAKLDFTKYSYDAATGQWCGRIRIPSFLAAADTVIVAAYGNPSINASQENQTGTFDAPIVAHWSMDSLGDSTASPADLATSATLPTLGPAKVANGFTLGTALWLRSAPAAKLTQVGPMTLCVWGKYTAALTDSLLVALGTGANYGMYAGDTVAGRPSFFVTQSGALRRATSSVARNDGLHHLFCGGYNNANALLNIDGGAEQVTGAAVAGTLSTDPSPMMTFGNVSSFGAPWCATCQVDEAFLYSQWMGPDWIRAMYLADGTPTAVTIGPEMPGPGGGYIFSIAMGTLPAGLTLSGATISGMPTAAGVSTFTARVTDSTASSDKPFTITINDVIGVTTVALPAGVIHQPYNQIFSASGGTPPFAWALQKGTLPPGLTITPVGLSTLKFGGTLSAHGFYVFTVRATDAAGAIEDHRYQMFVGSVSGINYSPLDIHWDFASGNVVVRYSYDCTVYDAATAAINASAGSAAVMLPRSATLCLKLDSTAELDVDVPSANISGFYLK